MNISTKKEREEIRKEIEEMQEIGRELIAKVGHDIRFTCVDHREDIENGN